MAELESSEDQGSKRPGVFKDLSMAQVIAGALASVTSMLLTEQIGIAGGIIGVVVSSVAYTVTAKVYGNMLASSGEKLRDHLGSDVTERISPTTPARDAYRTEPIARTSADGTRLMPRPVEPEGRAARHGADPREEATRRIALDSEQPQGLTAEGGRIAPPALRAQAAGKRQAEMRKKVIIVSVIAALVAVAVSALLVSALTAGNGLGAKPSQVSSASVSVTDEAATTKAATTHAAKTSAATAKTTEAETAAATSEATTKESAGASEESGNSESGSGSGSASNATTSGSGSSTNSGSAAASPQTQQEASTPTAKTEATSSSAAATVEASAQ